MARRGKGEGRGRIEPSFDDHEDVSSMRDLRATRDDDFAPEWDEEDEAPRPRKKVARSVKPRRASGSGKARPSRRISDEESWEFKTKRRSILTRLIYWGFILCLWGAIALAGLVAYYASQLPPIDQLAIPKRPPNIAIMAEDGALIVNRGDSGGPAIRLAELPPYLPKAFIAIEDRRFYHHFGIDPFGIARALVRNVIGHGNPQGGSTLTQQLAKNLFLTQERTLSRKGQEAVLALWLEHKYSKDQILELYLNRVYFGSGAYGVEAAARKYFGKSARSVSLAEAAVLAGLMKAPTKLAPNRNPSGATERAAQVIIAMSQEGYITESMAKLALSNPAQVAREDGAGSINYVADYVMDVLDETVGAIDQDIVVSTTLSLGLQAAAEKAVTEELDAKGAKFGVTQGALITLDSNGAIKAMVGGRNYADSQFNRATSAKRQPGSAFKPFVYLTAMEHGLTPNTVREDGPLNVKGWQPENYSHEYFGPVTLTNALALSLNTVAVRVGLEAGPKNIVKTAHRLGIQSELQPNASIALGTSEVTPLEMVTAYTPFSNGGIGVQPHIISKVRSAEGNLLYQRKATGFGRVIEPQYVQMMNTMMQETLLTGTARKAELPGWQAAGKTGTSQDYRDAWFVGYTSALVTGVWLGNDDSSPTKKTSGGNLPVEIWSRFMKLALKTVPPAPLPLGLWHPDSAAPPLDLGAPPTPAVNIPAANVPLASPSAPLPLSAPRPVQSGSNPPDIHEQPVVTSIRRGGAPKPDLLLPPADVPGNTRPLPAPKPAKSLLQELFGN
eukprot:gene8244-8328_t